jgi:hypothetical protein
MSALVDRAIRQAEVAGLIEGQRPADCPVVSGG